MKNKIMFSRMLISIGLFIVVLLLLLNDYCTIPDFFKGFSMGAGIVLELTGLYFMKKEKKNSLCQKNIQFES